ncbi:MAG: PQQ-binding-like beta-propeller repeat protein [Planctomycetia bacterium]|nr:PQQ-binding-like beta-propeller repeat protein [Planctomycetia bacterium]
MKRIANTGLIVLTIIILSLELPLSAVESTGSRLFTESQVNTVGLTRPWFNQVTLDTQFSGVSGVTLQDDVLFIVTKSGYLQAIDAERGTTLWGRQVGSGDFMTWPAAANSRVVIVMNGTTIYGFDRTNGKAVLECPVYGQPLAGPQVSERHIYVPLMTQKIYCYPLVPIKPEQEYLVASLKQMNEVRKSVPFSTEVEQRIAEAISQGDNTQYLLAPIQDIDVRFCTTLGLSLTRPTLLSQSLNEDYVAWVTDAGWLMVSRRDMKKTNELELLYKIAVMPETTWMDSRRLSIRRNSPTNPIESSPTFVAKDVSWQNMKIPEEKRKGGLILVGTLDGHVIAVNDETGDVRWKYLSSSPITDRISAVDSFCYVPTESGNLFCLSLETGEEVWHTGLIDRIVSLSKNCIYAIDHKGDLAVLRREDGTRMATLPMPKCEFTLFNDLNDRIFLVTEDGLVQCLRELQQESPQVWRPSSYDNAAALAKAEADYYEAIGRTPKADPLSVIQPAGQPAIAPAAAKPVVPEAAPDSGEEEEDAVSPVDDIFGEMTGEKPDAPEEEPAEEESDPFGSDDDIFN